MKKRVFQFGIALTAVYLVASSAFAVGGGRDLLILTSTNNPSGNDVVVFKLDTSGTPSLQLTDMLPTHGSGGASGNAGALQFDGNLGAVANFGSNSVTQLVRYNDFVSTSSTINLARGCVNPDSVALTADHLFIVGTNCAESHSWPWGGLDGSVVHLTDNSAGQIAAGKTWAAVTLKSGSVLQLPLTPHGALTGVSATITLPANANNTPLGAGFWGDLLGFTPAHSPDSFAVVDNKASVYPIAGPTPPYPTNAPCWVAKGPGSVWYTANSPGEAISIFFTDGKGGAFYKSIPLPGPPTDITVSSDGKYLAVIFTASGEGLLSVYSIDDYGDLTYVATSGSVGVPSFNGVGISQ